MSAIMTTEDIRPTTPEGHPPTSAPPRVTEPRVEEGEPTPRIPVTPITETVEDPRSLLLGSVPFLSEVTGLMRLDRQDLSSAQSYPGLLPTLFSRRELSQDHVGRRNEGALLGEQYLQRRVGYARMSRAVAKKYIKELDLLKELFRKVWLVPERGYFLDNNRYKSLKEALAVLKKRAMEANLDTEMGIPPLPMIGKGGNPMALLSANDYEVLGCAFCDEVESFLATMDQILGEVGSKKETSEEREMWEGLKKKPPPTPEATGVYQKTTGGKTPSDPIPPSASQVAGPSRPLQRNIRESMHFPDFTSGLKDLSTLPQFVTYTRGTLEDPSPLTTTYEREEEEELEYAGKGKGRTPYPGEFYGQHPRSQTYSPPRISPRRDPLPPIHQHIPGPPPGGDPDEDPEDQPPSGPPRRPPGRRPFASGSSGAGSSRGSRAPGGPGGPGDPPDPRDPPGPLGPLRPEDPNPQRNLTPVADPYAYVFDPKLKASDIPEWNGNSDTLAKWLKRVTQISERSYPVFRQLGSLVPQRLTGSAEVWYWSLPIEKRREIEADWGTLRQAIRSYYMNRSWLDKQKARANKASYRDLENSHELPSEYYIRKVELLTLVYNMSDSELILEIMNGAPPSWVNILNPHFYNTLVEFQEAIKYHEDNLLRMEPPREKKKFFFRKPAAKPKFKSARAHLVGWTSKMQPPKFPRDDNNVSKKPPESIGARPCRHCGSGKHWDPDCKYARKGNKAARVHAVEVDSEEEEAQAEYDDLYYGLSDEEETESTENQEDFHEALQLPESTVLHTDPVVEPKEETSVLEGEHSQGTRDIMVQATEEQDNPSLSTTVHHVATVDLMMSLKPSLNRRSRRRLAHQVAASHYSVRGLSGSSQTLLKLHKLMARPPGTSFLGSKATRTQCYLGSFKENLTDVIVDSGSDITLISLTTLEGLDNPPKVKTGQKINLIQVTGRSSISGFINTDIYFETTEGPVQLNVDAYVVKGMTTPFILGNDFADQYSISVMRKEGETYLLFGDTGRNVLVKSSTSPSYLDDEGHSFKISMSKDHKNKKTLHHHSQRVKKRERKALSDPYARSAVEAVIHPGTSKYISVRVNFPRKLDYVYIEKVFFNGRSLEDVYACPDSIIAKDNPRIHVTNFASYPIVIHKGQVLGVTHNPKTWLVQTSHCSNEDIVKAENYATLVRSIHSHHENGDLKSSMVASELQDKDLLQYSGTEDPLAEDPLEGGPKGSETPPDLVKTGELLKAVNISKDLTVDQAKALHKLLLTNHLAFGLDGRLGSHPGELEIKLRPESKEISLPPFGSSSPAKREVMDEQIDTWLNNGVISPSKSPWGAPAFIVYRNGKPRMVIDYRRLNAITIPDEFPLPRQEDILQALTGSQWLSTLDALAGFTQITIKKDDREKTAFRTHRGLHQFNRMPFGLRNGPSTFQRVMQGVLASYLWVFTLVYIDDIVVYSTTFEDHLKHLDLVFKAIIKGNITLAPNKCHFAYQSLLLLGQKVSRLGLSTHKEKVGTIVQLAEPKNVSELQTFLGMMVYFSAYIPYYAWIASPLFKLLRKDHKWDWGFLQQEAFELCKQVLVNAPVRAYAMPGLPYRLYTDACDYGLGAILQQVQPIKVKDLKGTRIYDKL